MDYYGWKLYLFLILWIILSVNTQALKDNSTSGFPVVYRTTTAITADGKSSMRNTMMVDIIWTSLYATVKVKTISPPV